MTERRRRQEAESPPKAANREDDAPRSSLSPTPPVSAGPTIREKDEADDKLHPFPAIRALGVRVDRGTKTILRGIELSAEPGEVLGVLGPSGAGKSTLFRTLVGEISPTSGRVELRNEDVTGLPLWERARRGLSYVPQTPSVLWDLTVRDNLLSYHRIVHGKRPRDEERSKIADLARRVDIEDRMDVRAGALSGGERRRLELARALTRPPKVLVCDEPFSGVDPQHASRLGDMLRSLAQEGVCVMLADHHVEEALRVCTRAVLLLDGEVAVGAEPEAFRAHPLVVGRYLGSWARTIPPPPPSRG